MTAPLVEVRRRIGPHATHSDRNIKCTSRFCATRTGATLRVSHDLRPEELCDDLAELLAAELDDAGVLRGQPEFEAVFVGVVQSMLGDADGDVAWLRFYRNTIERLEHGDAAFAPIHQRAASLVVGRTLVDLGSCFGFFPLRMSAAGFDVTATDLSQPTMALLDRMCVPLRRPVRTIGCNAVDVPLADGAADTVTVLHLLEHVDASTADAVIDEALRLARRRVIVAVPFEDVPRACYGHVQRFDPAILRGIADARRSARLSASVDEFHGGWLVFDR
jgi:Methyltransferase domain